MSTRTKKPDWLPAFRNFFTRDAWHGRALFNWVFVLGVIVWLANDLKGFVNVPGITPVVNFAVLALAAIAIWLNAGRGEKGARSLRALVRETFSWREDKYVVLIIGCFIVAMLSVVSWDLPHAYHPGDDEYVVPSMHMANGRLDTALKNPNLSQNPLQDNQHLMYYVLTPTFFFMKPIGLWLWGAATDPQAPYFFIARLLNYGLAGLVIFVTYLSSKVLFGRRVALVAAGLLAGSKLLVHYSLYMRSDILLTLFVAILVLLAALALRHGYRNYLLFGALVGLGLALKPYMLVFLAPVVFFLVLDFIQRPDVKQWFRSSALVFGGMLLLFHLGRFYHNYVVEFFGTGFGHALAHSGGGHYGLYPSVGMDLLNKWVFSGELLSMWTGIPFMGAVVAALIAMVVVGLRGRKSELFLAVTAIPAYFFLASQLVQEGKFFLVVYPLLVVAVAWFCVDLLARYTLSRIGGMILLAVVGIQFLYLSGGKLALLREPDVRTVAADWIEQNIDPGSNLSMLGGVGWQLPPVDRQAYGRVAVGPTTDYVVIPSSVYHKVEYFLENPESYRSSDWAPRKEPGARVVLITESIRGQSEILQINRERFTLVQVIKKPQLFLGLTYNEHFTHPASWELWGVNNPLPIYIYKRLDPAEGETD